MNTVFLFIMSHTIETFKTRHDGGKPFRAEVDWARHKIRAYKPNETSSCFAADFVHCFIGESQGPVPIASNDNYDGNTILIQTRDAQTYVLIAEKITQWTIPREITQFHSPIVNNCSYPFARDDFGNTYLFAECAIMGFSQHIADPYRAYYDLVPNDCYVRFEPNPPDFENGLTLFAHDRDMRKFDSLYVPGTRAFFIDAGGEREINRAGYADLQAQICARGNITDIQPRVLID